MAEKKRADRKAKKVLERSPLPEFYPGDTVKVFGRFVEGDKERVQPFQGTVLQIKGRGESRTFTVRRVSRGIGIERIFPMSSPNIVKIEVKKRRERVRRARLFYLRQLKGRDLSSRTATKA